MGEAKSQSQAKARDLNMTKFTSQMMRLINHTITQNEEEVCKEERMVEETLLEEEAEEE
jgi:hypothetical protein